MSIVKTATPLEDLDYLNDPSDEVIFAYSIHKMYEESLGEEHPTTVAALDELAALTRPRQSRAVASAADTDVAPATVGYLDDGRPVSQLEATYRSLLVAERASEGILTGPFVPARVHLKQ